jgi:adenine-specific DNA methylase
MTKRLIEDWLPIADLGEESVRERRSMSALPPIYYLHVWWARRPLVASRAAILASLLPADADRSRFLHAIGIHGSPAKTKARIVKAKPDQQEDSAERRSRSGHGGQPTAAIRSR